MGEQQQEGQQEIHVGMADLKVARAPAVLLSLGIGSCVGIILYDAVTKIGGLAHIMLPDINIVKNRVNRAKFANTAVPDMVEEMEKLGAQRKTMKARIMGGAHMFGFVKHDSILNIGERNIEQVKRTLEELRIRLVAEDIGGSYGRSVYVYLDTGTVKVRSVAHGEKLL